MVEFKNVVKPSEKRHPFQLEASTNPLAVIKDAFRLETLLVVGAAIQGVLAYFLPIRVALTPVAVYLLYRSIVVLLQSNNILPSDYTKSVIPGKVSSQLPERETGRFGSTPAAHSIVVFMLCVRFNHPLGMFSPGASEIVAYFQKMNGKLMAEADTYGVLGVSNWLGTDRKDSNTLMLMYYFRDLESVNRFAHEAVHRDGWDWYNRAKHSHLGIMHEAYSVNPGSYESIYANMPPTLMGGVSLKAYSGETGEEQWVRPLVAADKGVLRSQFGRMQRSAGQDNEKYGAEPVWTGQH